MYHGKQFVMLQSNSTVDLSELSESCSFIDGHYFSKSSSPIVLFESTSLKDTQLKTLLQHQIHINQTENKKLLEKAGLCISTIGKVHDIKEKYKGKTQSRTEYQTASIPASSLQPLPAVNLTRTVTVCIK